MTDYINVGLIGTSWWADLVHLPTLQSHPQAKIAAICGRKHVGDRIQQQNITLHGEHGALEGTTSLLDGAIRVARRGEQDFRAVPIPDHFWGDVDRSQPLLSQFVELLTKQPVGHRMFIDAILHDSPLTPTFHDGLKVQQVLDAALASQQRGNGSRWNRG